jgi:phosphate transport system substrate-binding protein
MRAHSLRTLSLLLSAASIFAADISIAGSSTVYPVVAEIAKDYAAAKVTVGQGGSSDGLKKVAAGSIAIAMSSRALKDEETAAGLVATPIGTDGIVFVVNKGNPLKALTQEQAAKVMTGAIANWSDLGGQAAPIVLVSLHEAHGTTDGLAHFLKLEFKGDGTAKTMAFAPKGGAYGTTTAIRTANHQETAAKLATNPGAIGFMPIGSAEAFIAKGTPIAMVGLDAVVPSTATVQDKTWPMIRPLLLVTKGAPADDAKAFIDTVLAAAGQAVVAKHGFVAVGK